MRRRSFVVLFACALPSAWLGCNAILGNDEARFVPPDAGSAGDDGPSPDSPPGDDGGSDSAVDAPSDVITCDADFANDPQNCGACEHDCLGGGCEGGTCAPVLLVTETAAIKGAAVDDTHVYWVNAREEIHRAPLAGGDGGPGDTLFTAPANLFTHAVASTGTKIYFGVASVTDGGVVARCDVTGCAGAPETVADADAPSAFAIGGGSLFWSREVGDGGIGTCALPACASASTVAGQERFPESLVVDGQEIFWSSSIGGYVHAAPLDGGAPRAVMNTMSSAYGVAVSGDKVFFSRLGMGIQVVPRAGGAPTLFSGAATAARSVAADATFVYFADHDTGAVYRCPRDGCTSIAVLATTNGTPSVVFLDAKSLFWVNEGAGTSTPAIWRLAR